MNKSPLWPILLAFAALAAAFAAYWTYESSVPETAAVVPTPSVATGAASSGSSDAAGPVAATGGASTGTTVGMANPASVNCIKKGGTLSIKKRPDGGEYGVCYFEDNRQCEEWALLRGDCPAGGRKVTGYDDEAQVFCAISGGTVHMENKPVSCELPNSAGSCSAAAFFADGAACAKG